MADKGNRCGNKHRFHEHSIGAGLTRKICSGCGLLQIGQGPKVVLTDNPWEETSPPLFVKAS
ncbi:MAG: hypothetical protein OEM84_14875 [Acidimicrobiia bacterium]|nr:hypothetical protein [Acidimicrobiia bacterium]